MQSWTSSGRRQCPSLLARLGALLVLLPLLAPLSAHARPATGTAAPATFFVSPSGADNATGTKVAPWRTITHAQSVAQAGDTVYLRGGRYAFDVATKPCASRTDLVAGVVLNKSGQEGRPIRYWAYPGEKPVLDFALIKDDCRVKGVEVRADWVHLKGLEITGAPQQPGNHENHESWGVWIKASHGVYEQLDVHSNMGTGLFIQGGSYNTVVNSDSHGNYDPYSSNGAGQNADGFGAHVGTGSPGNVFRGCRAWDNSDDGFDLINSYSPVTIESSWAWNQGYLPGTRTPVVQGNGNGIKAGGYDARYVSNAVRHSVRLCVAFDNKSAGFYANHHPMANEFFGNTAFGNGVDFDMTVITPTGEEDVQGILRNNLSMSPRNKLKIAGTDSGSSSNSWERGRGVPSETDFVDTSHRGWDAPRQADGSLPHLLHYRLRPNSPLVDAGIDVGLPYHGKAPDLGAFES
ncbi:pectate lyase [Acaromyces ingoldii]|uniref:Pectate lyase n=1 Tax=Acaromyces ingoldii TaxID=215250 RepID=A0A316YTG4_9BASI|nr:pectate lyase [Acaromyces ingoldii]PWN91035.1 pectate lyase [Acaromyces ingoldii]